MMIIFRAIFLLLMSPMLVSSQYCDFNGTEPPPINATNTCNVEMFENMTIPPLRNSSKYVPHTCEIRIILDLDKTLTSKYTYGNVLLFIKETVNTCMMRGIGNRTFIYPLFNENVHTICCGDNVCDHQINMMNYADYVGNYNSLQAVQMETGDANFTYALVDMMKRFNTDQCLYNTMVLITNRLFVTDELKLGKDVENIVKFSCVTFTIIAVGNNNITKDMMVKYYGKFTENLFRVPAYNCLINLNDCIKPCGPKVKDECLNVQLIDCPYPPITESPVTPTIRVTSTIPDDNISSSYWYIMYVFALSNRTTDDEFKRVVNFIQTPLQQCANQRDKITVRFLAKNNVDTGWLFHLANITSFLQSLQADKVLLNSVNSTVNEDVTLDLIRKAISIPHGPNGTREPRITLLTDFVSQNFIDAYNNKSDTLMHDLQYFDFEIDSFNAVDISDVSAIYKKKCDTLSRNIHTDINYGDSSSDLIAICRKRRSLVPLIMIIIVGTCTGAMAILIIATILYRQKSMWVEKLNRFKNSYDHNSEEEEMIDFWEISWEKVVIKNERLGHGAYGQVYKGKLIGPSIGVERFSPTEIAKYSDCDCAVKMLPRFASDSARAEFMHEIELMKTLGFHEHIVTMLGCITSFTKSCLVLEYCTNRDLLRYLKQRKIDLEINRSIDDKIDCTKEFLNFAWQVAQGMNYLGQKNIIHRDLAARNILITGMEGMKSAKISDFGLSISKESNTAVPARGRLPIKWLALECLQRELFSFQSDVWSYGIVLFEMYSMGEIPFANIEPLNLIPHLEAGNRPKRPLLASDKIAEVMERCWERTPEMRPSFEELLSTFATLLEEATEGYGYLALIKTAENYRVLSELYNPNELTIQNELLHHSDGQPRFPSKTSSKKINANTNAYPASRKRAITLRLTSQSSTSSHNSEYTHAAEEMVEDDDSNPSVEVGDDHHKYNEKVKRNKSHQLPSLNLFNHFRKLRERRGSFPT